MGHRVGTKGQVVIEKWIRDKLGIEPGWFALQRVIGERTVEITFLPGEHDESLRGSLKSNISIPPDQWHEALEAAWANPTIDRARRWTDPE